MGEEIDFEGISGYLSGDGPAGVVVLHEWDGLVPHMRHVTDRLASVGFTSLAPDLYDGVSAPWGDVAEAQRLQRQILRHPEAAAARIALALGELRKRGHPKVAPWGTAPGVRYRY